MGKTLSKNFGHLGELLSANVCSKNSRICLQRNKRQTEHSYVEIPGPDLEIRMVADVCKNPNSNADVRVTMTAPLVVTLRLLTSAFFGFLCKVGNSLWGLRMMAASGTRASGPGVLDQGPLLTSTDKCASSALGTFPSHLHCNAKPGSLDLCTSDSERDSSFLSVSLVSWLTLILLPSGLSQCTEHLLQSPTNLELQEPDSCSALPTPSVSHGGLWTSLPTSPRNLGVGASYWDSLKDRENGGGMASFSRALIAHTP